MFDFGLRLQALRKQKNLSQDELAKKINKSKSVVSGYENNVKTPPIDVLINLALIYNVSADYLVGLEEKEMISIDELTEQQRRIIFSLISELKNLNNNKSLNLSKGLSTNQQDILNSIIIEFVSKK